MFDRHALAALLCVVAAGSTMYVRDALANPPAAGPVELGSRPAELLTSLADGPLKDRLTRCLTEPGSPTRFSIGHRGAPLRHPEHTRPSYLAAVRQGAGVVECDATFTADQALVCRHDQCDLHATTDILETRLAARCVEPFRPADPLTGVEASARCCTSDLTLAEYRSLCGRMGQVDPSATSVSAYLAPGMPPAAAGDDCAAPMTHAESIELLRDQGVAMTPELKQPRVSMPFQESFSTERYAAALLDAYRAADVPAERVWPQSFDLDVVRYWLTQHPDFAAQVIWLDGRYSEPGFDPSDPATWSPGMTELRTLGLRYLAPPIPVLVTAEDGRIVPTAYARAARAAGLELITWTLERPGTMLDGGFYVSSVASAVSREGDVFRLLDTLANEVGVIGVFSDWPATTTFFANCMGL